MGNNLDKYPVSSNRADSQKFDATSGEGEKYVFGPVICPKCNKEIMVSNNLTCTFCGYKFQLK
jgi:hypothetical protein